MHAKWAVNPQVLDDTAIHAPLPAFAAPMEFDTAFHAAYIEYLRIRSAHLTTGHIGDLAAVRKVIAEMRNIRTTSPSTATRCCANSTGSLQTPTRDRAGRRIFGRPGPDPSVGSGPEVALWPIPGGRRPAGTG